MDPIATINKDQFAPLYQAQKTAYDLIFPDFFPCYSPEYVESTEGFKGSVIYLYMATYDTLSHLKPLLDILIITISTISSWILTGTEFVLSPVLDAIYPINPVNGKRHFIGVPKSWEVAFGKMITSSVTAAWSPVSKSTQIEGRPMSDLVSEVFHNIEKANPDILNPPTEKTKFKYEVQTMHSETLNAFAVMGGSMVVLSKIVEEISNMVNSGQHNSVDVQFPDGSKATVDMRGITTADVLAALMGHEMTHVASRHSVVKIIGNLINMVGLFIARILCISKLKSSDKEYQELSTMNEREMTVPEYKRLLEKEKNYARIGDLIDWVGSKLRGLLGLHHSRAAEYEADITGAYLAHKAGYDPRGAIFLHEVLLKAGGGKGMLDSMHEKFEFLFTHPHGENRKRGAFAAISEIAPATLKAHVVWDTNAKSRFDVKRSSDTSVKFAIGLRDKLGAIA